MLAGAGRADLLAASLLHGAIYKLVPFAFLVVALGLLSLTRRDTISSTVDSV